MCDAFVHPSRRAAAYALRRADRGASGLQPCGTSMGRLHHASTTARHAAARAMFMENRRCKCTWSLRRSIFDLHVASLRPISWRQALAGSTLRSSARGNSRGRRGPLRSRGTVAEVCPRSGSIRSRSSTHPAERQASQRARAAGVAASRIGAPVPLARPEPPCLAASHRSGLVGQLSGPGSGGAARSTARHQRVAKQSRNAQHPARDTWLPRQTPPT